MVINDNSVLILQLLQYKITPALSMVELKKKCQPAAMLKNHQRPPHPRTLCWDYRDRCPRRVGQPGALGWPPSRPAHRSGRAGRSQAAMHPSSSPPRPVTDKDPANVRSNILDLFIRLPTSFSPKLEEFRFLILYSKNFFLHLCDLNECSDYQLGSQHYNGRTNKVKKSI